MKARITIPEPCNADWNGMQSNEKGRHCDLCALTVIDFTEWELPDIAAYLQNNSGKKVCGRFLDTQINQPFDLMALAPKVIQWSAPVFRKIAALIVICFAITITGCNMGAASSPETELLGDTVMVQPPDTLAAPATLGTPANVETIAPSQPKAKHKKHAVKAEGIKPSGYTTAGAPMLEMEREIMPQPPVKEGPKYQPPIGPPEDDGKMNESK